jgi:hypothetical protein
MLALTAAVRIYLYRPACFIAAAVIFAAGFSGNAEAGSDR